MVAFASPGALDSRERNHTAEGHQTEMHVRRPDDIEEGL